jgi:hypothetical protein
VTSSNGRTITNSRTISSGVHTLLVHAAGSSGYLIARTMRTSWSVACAIWHPVRQSNSYAQINAFERMLVENGTTVLKFMLHISKGERERQQARLD